jgi:hypothetical protein
MRSVRFFPCLWLCLSFEISNLTKGAPVGPMHNVRTVHIFTVYLSNIGGMVSRVTYHTTVPYVPVRTVFMTNENQKSHFPKTIAVMDMDD